MKHRLLLFMVVILVLSMPGRASAAYKWFVPDHGQVRVWSTGFSLQSLDWDADALSFRWWDAVEFEIRATQAGKTIGDFFSGLGSTWSGTLPGKYREYDQDDVTLGCWSPHLIDHYSTYQAMTYMIPHPDLPTNLRSLSGMRTRL